MSISQKIELYYKNQIENIKKEENKNAKMRSIGHLIMDIGKNSINAIANACGCCWRYAKKCFYFALNLIPTKEKETRGRKKLIVIFPNIKNDIEKVIENHKQVDSHFKTDVLSVTLDPKIIINELVANYNYPDKFASYNSIVNLLHEMGYKYHKIPKTKIINKVPETDAIFENVKENLETITINNDKVCAISIDDKTAKKIGMILNNGMTWEEVEALDHDTIFEYSVKPFGILDLKTNETFVTCTTNNSTAEFKVDCIEQYLINKLKNFKLKKLLIFLDNGPENSSKRSLWLKKLVDLAIKYNIVIQLVYYPPYCSKYNKIERVWATVQIKWRRILIDSFDKLITCLNEIKWNGVNMRAQLSTEEYEKGIKISDYEMENYVNKHIIRDKGLEKWSLYITPFAN